MFPLKGILAAAVLILTLSAKTEAGKGKTAITKSYGDNNTPDGCRCSGTETFDGMMRPFVVTCQRRVI